MTRNVIFVYNSEIKLALCLTVPLTYMPAYLIVITEVTNAHMFIHVVMIEVFFHPSHITPVNVPLAITTVINITNIIVSHTIPNNITGTS